MSEYIPDELELREEDRAYADHFNGHVTAAVDILALLEGAAGNLHAAARRLDHVAAVDWGGDGELGTVDYTDATTAFAAAHRELQHVVRIVTRLRDDADHHRALHAEHDEAPDAPVDGDPITPR